MGFKAFAAKKFARFIHKQTKKWSLNPHEAQRNVFQTLIETAKNTQFGIDHDFANIKTYCDFASRVPIADYEKLKAYIELVKDGKEDILWPGKPIYFAKTSGTTSGAKYIPITKDSIPNHINSARNALLAYVHETGNASFLNGKLIFLSGSPALTTTNGIHTGRLSGIANHHVPGYLRSNQLPSFETNCIEDWEQKVEAIAKETSHQNMTLISGIPPWVQMYFDVLKKNTGKKASDLFPNFSLFVYGGVNFEPYRNKLEESIGKKIDSIELFPASEGFFAYQDSQKEDGLLLLLDSGIFYEFIPLSEIGNANPKRLSIEEVELNENYALIINSNAGLWGYNLGDTIKFVSKNPYRIKVTGRIKHFISAFGEHVIGEEVDKAIQKVSQKLGVEVIEFHVAPQVNPIDSELPYHEWFAEFGDAQSIDLENFAVELNAEMVKQNIYYQDLMDGKILRPLVLRKMQKNAFINYMRAEGKLGGQNKLPRLANDRKLAEKLTEIVAKP